MYSLLNKNSGNRYLIDAIRKWYIQLFKRKRGSLDGISRYRYPALKSLYDLSH